MKIAQKVRGKSKTASTITHSLINEPPTKTRFAGLYSARTVTTHDGIKATQRGGWCCGAVMVGLGGGMRAGGRGERGRGVE